MNDTTDKLSTLMDGELRDHHEQGKLFDKLASDSLQLNCKPCLGDLK